MWWRWNQSTHIFEKSTDNGGSYSAAPVHADTISEGLLGSARITRTGSWTPVIGGDGGTSGQTYTLQSGKYIRKGEEVTLRFRVVLSNKGTITGNVMISGFPFAVVNDTAQGNIRVGYFGGMGASFVYLAGHAVAAQSYGLLYGLKAAATGMAALAAADISNSTDIMGVILYEAVP